MHGNSAYMRESETHTKERFRDRKMVKVLKTSLARDGVMHLRGFKGSLQDDKRTDV